MPMTTLADYVRFGEFLTNFLRALTALARQLAQRQGYTHHAARLEVIHQRILGALGRYELGLDDRLECPPALFIEAVEILFAVSDPDSDQFALGEQALRIIFTSQLLHADQVLLGRVGGGFRTRLYYASRNVALMKRTRHDEERELREVPDVVAVARHHLGNARHRELAQLLDRCLAQLRSMIARKAALA